MIVYLLAMISDWLQGPYVYQLYVSYGFLPHEIGLLFVGGFGSSLVFGTFIGSLADKYGRKKTCLIYSICYILACCTKSVNDFWVLMVGRILCGISTSLLFSSFESWMVCEHGRYHMLTLLYCRYKRPKPRPKVPNPNLSILYDTWLLANYWRTGADLTLRCSRRRFPTPRSETAW